MTYKLKTPFEQTDKQTYPDVKQELITLVVATYLTDRFYELQPDLVQRTSMLISRCELIFVAKLAIFTRHQAGLKRASYLLTGLIAQHISGSDWAKRFYFQVIKWPDDIGAVLSFMGYMNSQAGNVRGMGRIKVPRALKAGFKKYLEELEPCVIDNFKMKKRIFSLNDMLNFFHPNPSQKNKEAFNRLQKGMSLKDLYDSTDVDKMKSQISTDAIIYEQVLNFIASSSESSYQSLLSRIDTIRI